MQKISQPVFVLIFLCMAAAALAQSAGIAADDSGNTEAYQIIGASDFEPALNQAQEISLQSLQRQHASQRQEYAQKLSDIYSAINLELSRKNPDGTQLLEYAAESADLIEKAAQMRIEYLLDAKKVLSPEQFERFINMNKNEDAVESSD